MISKRFIHHLPHMATLYGIFAVAALVFLAFSYNKSIQVAAVAAAASAYVIWGIVHHMMHKDLTLSVVIEYVVFALLGFVVGVSVILRG